MPVPTRMALDHYRGDTFAALLRLWVDEAATDPADLTGAVITAQVRPTADSTTVVATFEITVDDNEVTLVLPPEVTATLPPKAVYDVQVDWDGAGDSVQTVLAGDLSVVADVTRAV